MIYDSGNPAKIRVARVKVRSEMTRGGVDDRIREVQPVGERVVGGLEGDLVVQRNQPSGAEVHDRFESGRLSLKRTQLPVHLVNRDHGCDDLARAHAREHLVVLGRPGAIEEPLEPAVAVDTDRETPPR